MLFNSLQFLLFFPIVTVIYFLIKGNQVRWLWLLLASCYFYMAFIPAYLLILFVVILIDFSAGILIEKSQGSTREVWLIVSLIANIGLLAVFKYFNFLNSNIAQIFSLLHLNYSIPGLAFILPIGLSFHTFQSMSYTIEVYRGNYPAQKNILLYSLYVMFFPQLVAGPIERPFNIFPQFSIFHKFDANRVAAGLKLMVWGFFKKMVIADRLSMFVDEVFNTPKTHHGWSVIIAVFFFAIQIYCDFSGYTDIAIGAARILGINLMTNFNFPYFSKSVNEFWHRWHISLSTWFRDYLYIPLGGSRVVKWRWYYNLFITFLISGLWHGAAWTFIIWGGLHGLAVIFEVLTKKARLRIKEYIGAKIYGLSGAVITFCYVSFAWIFFRASSLENAVLILKNMFNKLGDFHLVTNTFGAPYFKTCILVIFILAAYDFIDSRWKVYTLLEKKPFVFRMLVYNLLVAGVLFLGIYTKQEFIYFQF